ncbi:MAG: DNA polymerase III subunit epsilon [Gammaproteobacteria bacterium]|jgi:DNA polymerase-3 subunit epsilon|nr:DNA polymerase III subunit epsilon [Gammaproteobacteria bacterium]MBT3489178.1 DNA polymerase III subunit epsilon [Gammaproteobacteria bacterium]MBT3717559.1 DNA polymerase III subunit epsilon [Gammaproteobacteria bacterium]MBT3845312.1 DNA polymerase III subunit epsilon [Gammaproteobacteria bacterium]MBT3892527.1 DNA polymerase III subunit epsilon [Gammaproteobacteria bacterium]
MRQVILDTETTGLEPKQGHRIIEIGCVEMVNRRLTNNHYHQYIQPERTVDQGAIEVHGITNKYLADKPLFGTIVDEFLDYVRGAELVIHNAPFDVGFINHELNLLQKGYAPIEEICTITDSLQMARKQYPGQKNNLDALCRRLDIDNTQRSLHGALLDSEILAEVYLAMTGGQTGLDLDGLGEFGGIEPVRHFSADRQPLTILKADEEELAAHRAYLEKIGAEAW